MSFVVNDCLFYKTNYSNENWSHIKPYFGVEKSENVPYAVVFMPESSTKICR